MKAATAARVAGCAAQLRTFDALRPLPGILILIATISLRKLPVMCCLPSYDGQAAEKVISPRREVITIH